MYFCFLSCVVVVANEWYCIVRLFYIARLSATGFILVERVSSRRHRVEACRAVKMQISVHAARWIIILSPVTAIRYGKISWKLIYFNALGPRRDCYGESRRMRARAREKEKERGRRGWWMKEKRGDKGDERRKGGRKRANASARAQTPN